jgi:DNA-binding HxlR family transcriptional regulator
VAEVLRVLGGGAAGSVLLVLADGPLRTGEITDRVSGFTPRTVYRYLAPLTALGVLERDEEPGVPSKVVYSLADPCGVELHELVDAYASATLEALPDGMVISQTWHSLTLIANLWESGMFGKLAAGPSTQTELARLPHGLSFHTVGRWMGQFVDNGLMRKAATRRHYELTERARQAAVLIAGLGRWRERHCLPRGRPGLTPAEVADLLRAALPLASIPKHAGEAFDLGVSTPGRGKDIEMSWAVGPRGVLAPCVESPAQADARARGGAGDWIETLVGDAAKVRVGGDRALIESCLQQLHAALRARTVSSA